MGWDGTTFLDIDYGKRLNDHFVMIGHPWLQYYAAAASFALFGETTLAARLPFAVAGLGTIALVYVIVWRLTQHRVAATTAALLLTLSVQFLLYSRQSRHYSLNALLTCLLLLQFTRLRSIASTLVFVAIAVMLFHAHPIGLAAVLALTLLPFVYPAARHRRRWVLLAAPLVGVLSMPWMLLARGGYSEATAPLRDLGRLLPRLGQFAVEIGSVTSMFAIALVALVARHQLRRNPAPRLRPKARPRGSRPTPLEPRSRPALRAPDEREFVWMVLATMIAYALVMAITQSRDSIWQFGLRYTSAILPFSAIVSALIIRRLAGANWRIWVACVLVLGFTRLGRLTPYTFWQDPTPLREMDAAVTFHTPPNFIDRVFRTGQLRFVESLFKFDRGTSGEVIEYLNRHAKPGDVLITNYGWEPLYFHTGLPQGMKVLPSWPVYGAARARGLPEYVFSAEGARWIVWRRAWGNYLGHDIGLLIDELDRARVPLTRVAEIPETLWENRENIHFRRYPDDEYIYPWYPQLPHTVVYRIGP